MTQQIINNGTAEDDNTGDHNRVAWDKTNQNFTELYAVTYQPLDGDLTAIAALTGTNTIYYRSAANTWAAVTIGANLTFTGGNLAAGGNVSNVGTPTAGQLAQWTDATHIQGISAATFLKKNYIINGAMMISQENGTTAGTASGYFPVDQFAMFFSNSGTQTVQQVASATPAGSPNRFRVTATVADAAVAAADFCLILQNFEGLQVADLRSGLASAKTITVQFGVKAPAGTYCVAIRNASTARSYVATYTISAGEPNTDVVKSVTIALDQTGTWPADNTAAFSIAWTLMAGSTIQTTANLWANGNFLATSAQFNFVGSNGNVFELFDVGIYEGTAAPAFQVPNYATDLLMCQRYYEKIGMTVVVATPPYNNTSWYRVTKRVSPTITLISGSLNSATVSAVTYSPSDGLRQIDPATTPADVGFSINARP